MQITQINEAEVTSPPNKGNQSFRTQAISPRLLRPLFSSHLNM